jgi:hypothetical protein
MCAETGSDDVAGTVTVTVDFEEVLHPVSDPDERLLLRIR